jgi:hypothetical protein
MAATGEVADPSADDVAPYIEPVTSLDQVEVGDLVVVRPPIGKDKIQKVKGKHDDPEDRRGPAVDVGTYKVYLDPRKGGLMAKIKLFRRPAAGAAAAAGDGGDEETEGGKRRRGKSRRGKSRRGVRKSRKSTRRRRA